MEGSCAGEGLHCSDSLVFEDLAVLTEDELLGGFEIVVQSGDGEILMVEIRRLAEDVICLVKLVSP